jgi:hypothetical protein
VEVGGGFLTTPPIHIRSGKPIRFLIKKNFYNNIMNYIIKHEVMPQSIVGKKKKKKKIFYVHTLPYLPPLTLSLAFKSGVFSWKLQKSTRR